MKYYKLEEISNSEVTEELFNVIKGLYEDHYLSNEDGDPYKPYITDIAVEQIINICREELTIRDNVPYAVIYR